MSQGDFPFCIEDVAQLLHLNVRRRTADGAYVDCPICGDKRGKMKLNYDKNIWRCNYCGEYGGMLSLYAKMNNVNNSEAYRAILDALQTGLDDNYLPYHTKEKEQPVKDCIQPTRADPPVIDKTLSGLLGMLKLSEQHREHLKTVRGLSDEQIDRIGFKSTPPFYMCKPLTDRLIANGYTVEGVPGFYKKDSYWTVSFSTITAGILIPVRGIDGLIHGCQIRLDKPIKEPGCEDKQGTKYIWLSSASKPCGTSSGSPAQYVGEPYSRVVYVTEGYLKSYIANALMNRTFVAIAGANNTGQLDPLFAYLAANGTEEIIEADDMDKFNNKAVYDGISKVYLLARKHGLRCRKLTWNPNYKGIDDWQLAIKRRINEKEANRMNFKQRFIYGLCPFEELDREIAVWQDKMRYDCKMTDYLGFDDEEYDMLLNSKDRLKEKLLQSRRTQFYRVYQLDFTENPVVPFAFCDITKMHEAGYEQPPASMYRLVWDTSMYCFDGDGTERRLQYIVSLYGDDLPENYPGRSIAPSDIIELYDGETRQYFYCDKGQFRQVKFSPMLALPIKS